MSQVTSGKLVGKYWRVMSMSLLRDMLAKSRVRYDICKKCDKYDAKKDKCSKCGCVMKFKTKIPSARCPIGKW